MFDDTDSDADDLDDLDDGEHNIISLLATEQKTRPTKENKSSQVNQSNQANQNENKIDKLSTGCSLLRPSIGVPTVGVQTVGVPTKTKSVNPTPINDFLLGENNLKTNQKDSKSVQKGNSKETSKHVTLTSKNKPTNIKPIISDEDSDDEYLRKTNPKGNLKNNSKHNPKNKISKEDLFEKLADDTNQTSEEDLVDIDEEELDFE